MRRGVLLRSLWASALLAVALPLLAAQTADIALGGGLVARIREKGNFPSIEARAAHIDKQLVEVVSNEDTLHPQVSLKQDKSRRWTVYAWETPIISVFPAEAKANGLSEKQMGAIWAANLKRQLPLATPCSKLPPEMLGYGKPGAAKPAAAAQNAAPKTVPASNTVMVAQNPTPAATAATTKPTTAPVTGASESGALLLIVDALRTAREMDEQSWVAGKESLARNLYADLSYYLTGKGTPPPPSAPKPAATTAKPTTVTAPVAKPATAPAPAAKPAAAAPTPKPASATAAAAPKTDPSMAKVPQKNRIRAKFAQAKPAYDKLVASDPEAAKAVSELLAGSRQAFAKGDFDESERLVDEALKALGVQSAPAP